MKYFKHELLSRENDKIYELIEAHGMQGYGIWWALLEELYKADSSGFQIEATETWFKRLSKRLCLTDWRALIRTLDTMAEQGLIDSQLWAEHVIMAPGITERADEYMRQKALATERKRQQREREKQAKEAEEAMSRVTAVGQVECHAGVTPNPDPDPNSSSNLNSNPERDLNPDRAHEKPRPAKKVVPDVPVAQPEPEFVEAELVEESEPASALPRSGQIDRYENPGMSRAEKMEARMNKDLYPWRFVSQEESRAFTEFLAKQGQRKGESLAKAQAIAVQQINNANHSDPNTKDHGRILGLWQLFKENMSRSQSLTEVIDGAMSPVMKDLTTHVLSKIQGRRAAG